MEEREEIGVDIMMMSYSHPINNQKGMLPFWSFTWNYQYETKAS